jgi:hypothetical protein
MITQIFSTNTQSIAQIGLIAATLSLTNPLNQLYNSTMKIKKTLKGLGLWTRKKDMQEQIKFVLTTSIMIGLLLVLVRAFQ